MDQRHQDSSLSLKSRSVDFSYGRGPARDPVDDRDLPRASSFRLEGPEDDHILEQIRATGTFYEVDLLRALDHAFRRADGPDVAVDVGANIGNHAVFFGRVLEAAVLCVEPCEMALPFLEMNLEGNGLGERSEVVRAAAARDAGEFFINEMDPGNLGMVRVEEAPTGEHSSRVRALPLDRIVRQSELARGRRVDLIKIDVEGAEESVLAGAESTIRNHAPVVVVEVFREDGFRRVARWMVSRGYSVSGPYAHTPVYVFTKDRLGDNVPLIRLLSDDLRRVHRHIGSDPIDPVDCGEEAAAGSGLLQRVDSLTSRLEGVESRIAELHWRRDLDYRQQRRLNAGRARVATLERELEEIRGSARQRVGDAMVEALESPADALRLPGRLLRIWREVRARDAREGRRQRADRREIRARNRQFREDFEQFARRVDEEGPGHFVVMFSGTTYIQDIRANRPIRLTRALLDMNVPVLFNFHRWHEDGFIPPYDRPLLLQSPVDLTPRLVRKLVDRDLGGSRRLLVVSYPHPNVSRLINLANVNGWATIYDCRDDWEEFSRVGMAKWYREPVERFVVANCDLTCCVSGPLRDKMKRLCPGADVRLSPNAYDTGFLTPGYESDPVDPPIIGYFGHLTDRWFDWESLAWMARERPGYRFEIIGHGAPDDPDVPENVSLLGPKRHAEICEHAARWSVGIIPFRMSKLADGVDPIKIYEYFSLGLPVVSFRMPQIASYPYTQTVETRPGFLAALDRSVDTRCDPAVLSEFLDRNTWKIRVREMLEWCDELLHRDDPVKKLAEEAAE